VAVAAVLLLPVIALTVLEFAGVTHLFRLQQTTADPVKVGKDELDSEGWVQLFNGKDLSGWKKHPIKPGFWRVDEIGHIVGAGPVDYAFLGTVRDDFEDFHLRVEAMVDTPESDSGVFFRVPILVEPSSSFAEININPGNPGEQTGSLLVRKEGKDAWYPAARGLTKPKEWFLLEIIARGDHVVTKVNGKLALDTEAPTANRRGHIFLQQCGGKTIVRFRKIEIKELPATSAPLKYGDPEYTNTLGMKFKLIPAGKFTMGSPKEEIDRCLKQPGPYKGNLPTEGPEHPVEITRPFYLGATEVTVGQFRRFVEEEGYQVGDGRWRNPEFDQTDQHPVVFVSWNNAVDFCKWLSKREGKEYRLPTEAEWEYSCRAGKAGSRYGFGDDDAQLKDYAWFDQNSGGGTHPVGKKKPNAWGLYDMHGNAWEWCQDNSDPDYYKNSPVKDPPGGAGGGRVGRGGGSVHGPVLCRSAFRGYLGPDDHRGAGFRVLLVSPPAGVGTESGAKDKPVPTAITPFTDVDVQRIAALPAEQQVEEVRKELMRRNPDFGGQVERKIENGVVTEFRIVTAHVTDIAPVRVFNALRVLSCGGTFTGQPNGLLADLTPLEGMNLSGLTDLGLNCTKVNDADMVYFKDCKALTRLALNLTNVTDAGLANFKDCHNLTVLELAGTKVSDAGLANFKDCKNLTQLYLHRMPIGDAGLANFKGTPLRVLWIENTGITDLTPLQGMPLEDIRLTPKNITRGLDMLRDMKSLKTIGIKYYSSQAWPAAKFWERYDKGEFK
jgi:formylglycine-generating enzyme required for sulfatase activity